MVAKKEGMSIKVLSRLRVLYPARRQPPLAVAPIGKLEVNPEPDSFSWPDFQYEMGKVEGNDRKEKTRGMRKLSDQLNGYVNPWKSTALMGKSRVGKVSASFCLQLRLY